MNFIEILFVLLFLHFLADFSLQSEAMAKGKNRHFRSEYILKGEKNKITWFYWLTAHTFIQGGLIFIFFPIIWIALIEVVFHFLLDFLKCDNVTNPHIDQGLHVLLRIIYAMVIFCV